MRARCPATLTTAALVLLAAAAGAEEAGGVPEDWPPPIMGGHSYGMLVGDRLEAGFGDTDGYLWDVQGWYGGGHSRWWIKTEGEGEQGGSPGHAELQVLHSRMFSPFWEWKAGVRHDFRPGPSRSHLVLGLIGTAPYEIEIDSALFVSNEGDVRVRLEAEYGLHVTQRLILQPRLELNAAFTEDRAIGIGSGLNRTEVGLRLRYEIRRELAPYVGVSWKRLHGETADLGRLRGEDGSVSAIVLGIRAWF